MAMRALVTDPERARRQAERASEVMATMTWDRQKLAYFAVIDRMVARSRTKRPEAPRAGRPTVRWLHPADRPVRTAVMFGRWPVRNPTTGDLRHARLAGL